MIDDDNGVNDNDNGDYKWTLYGKHQVLINSRL